jgi:hypothetical protein
VKVPTELRYTKTPNADGETVEWGFQIPGLVDRYQWFKLYNSLLFFAPTQ